MKPYYEADGITIYHGDALEVLGEIGPAVLVRWHVPGGPEPPS